MYNGHAYTDTMLHMDAADAVNFPVYMEGLGEESEWWSGDEAEGYALWLLWGREDVEPLRQYLREHFQLGPNIDPINLGDLRITRDMFEVLKARGIQPYVVHQRVGQAVIIPALTPHYVRLYTNRSPQTNFIVP
jgi:hypothetical protein